MWSRYWDEPQIELSLNPDDGRNPASISFNSAEDSGHSPNKINENNDPSLGQTFTKSLP